MVVLKVEIGLLSVAMLTYDALPKNTSNVLILSKHWLKIFKCGSINIESVMLVVEVKEFF